jgi:hypothetical protein
VFLHASGGILVALAVLYSNSITKTVAVCGALVLTTILGNVFFDAPLNGPILLGCLIVILSIFGYRDDCNIEDQLKVNHVGLEPTKSAKISGTELNGTELCGIPYKNEQIGLVDGVGRVEAVASMVVHPNYEKLLKKVPM